MSLNPKIIIGVLIYALAINLTLIQLVNLGIGISCTSLEDVDYSQSYNLTQENNTELKESSASIIDLALNRCDGLPYWIFVMFELPVIVGLLYIIRGFIGLT